MSDNKSGGTCGCIVLLFIGYWIFKIMFTDSDMGAKYGTLGEITYWGITIIALIFVIGIWWISRE